MEQYELEHDGKTYHLEVDGGFLYLIVEDKETMGDTDIPPTLTSEEGLAGLKEAVWNYALEPQYEEGNAYIHFPSKYSLSLDTLTLIWACIAEYLENLFDIKPEKPSVLRVKDTGTLPIQHKMLDYDDWLRIYKPIMDEDEVTIKKEWTPEELQEKNREFKVWTLLSSFEEERTDYYLNKYRTRFSGGIVVAHVVTEIAHNPVEHIEVEIWGVGL